MAGATEGLLSGMLVGVTFAAVLVLCWQFAWIVYDTKYNFLGRSPAERRESFKTEAAFYYNFFEDVVEQVGWTCTAIPKRGHSVTWVVSAFGATGWGREVGRVWCWCGFAWWLCVVGRPVSVVANPTRFAILTEARTLPRSPSTGTSPRINHHLHHRARPPAVVVVVIVILTAPFLPPPPTHPPARQPTMGDALTFLAAHPSVEAPKTIDAIMRFNIHPEMFFGWLYRLAVEHVPLVIGGMDSIVFYTRATMLCWGVDKALLFLAAVLACGSGSGGRGGGYGLASTAAGLVTVLAGFGNVNYYSRIWNHPPLREHFGMPFVSLMYVGLFLAMPLTSSSSINNRTTTTTTKSKVVGGQQQRATSASSSASAAEIMLSPALVLRLLGLCVWFVGVVGLLLCWQLGLFILFGQVASLVVVAGVYRHRSEVKAQAEQLLATTLVALLVAL
jgi:hypothetical protein